MNLLGNRNQWQRRKKATEDRGVMGEEEEAEEEEEEEGGGNLINTLSLLGSMSINTRCD